MRTLRRKTLMVEDDKVKELARRRGTSESEAVRDSVDYALAAAKIMKSVRAIHALGSINHPLDKLPNDDGGEA
jgi:hypothetical protein